MKSKIAFLAAALLSLSAMALEPEIVFVKDEFGAEVLYQKGTLATYATGASQDKDGKVTVTMSEHFTGERLVKTASGSCATLRKSLLRLETITVHGIDLQLLTFKNESEPSSCGAKV